MRRLVQSLFSNRKASRHLSFWSFFWATPRLSNDDEQKRLLFSWNFPLSESSFTIIIMAISLPTIHQVPSTSDLGPALVRRDMMIWCPAVIVGPAFPFWQDKPYLPFMGIGSPSPFPRTFPVGWIVHVLSNAKSHEFWTWRSCIHGSGWGGAPCISDFIREKFLLVVPVRDVTILLGGMSTCLCPRSILIVGFYLNNWLDIKLGES